MSDLLDLAAIQTSIRKLMDALQKRSAYADLKEPRDKLFSALGGVGDSIKSATLSPPAKAKLQALRDWLQKGTFVIHHSDDRTLELLRECQRAMKPKKRGNEERNRFIYTRRAKGDSLQQVLNAVNKHQEWERLTTLQSISKACKEYAEDHGKPWPLENR